MLICGCIFQWRIKHIWYKQDMQKTQAVLHIMEELLSLRLLMVIKSMGSWSCLSLSCEDKFASFLLVSKFA